LHLLRRVQIFLPVVCHRGSTGYRNHRRRTRSSWTRSSAAAANLHTYWNQLPSVTSTMCTFCRETSVFTDIDAVHKRGLCCRPVSVCSSVCHVGTLYLCACRIPSVALHLTYWRGYLSSESRPFVGEGPPSTETIGVVRGRHRPVVPAVKTGCRASHYLGSSSSFHRALRRFFVALFAR